MSKDTITPSRGAKRFAPVDAGTSDVPFARSPFVVLVWRYAA
jgi:hypothetical protein